MKYSHLLALLLVPVFLTACWGRQDTDDAAPVTDTTTEATDDTPLPADVEIYKVPDITESLTYTAPAGYDCERVGDDLRGYYVTCTGAEGSNFRIGALPYVPGASTVEEVAAYVAGNFSATEDTTSEELTLDNGMEVIKITADITQDGVPAAMASYLTDANGMAYTINQLESSRDALGNEAFMSFLSSITIADMPQLGQLERLETLGEVEEVAPELVEEAVKMTTDEAATTAETTTETVEAAQ
ncbi:hypothetical protein H6771_02795 [Candidatus Peribacteria bacterium]|nr:hypothetical protein [Candidatus Peribacteria bacterium]